VPARPGNGNALKHGGYALLARLSNNRLDGRSEVGVALRQLRQNLGADLGGLKSLSTQQRILLDRAVRKVLILEAMENYVLTRKSLFKRNGELVGCLGKNYLAFSAELRRDLVTLGLKRHTKDLNLKDYLRETQR